MYLEIFCSLCGMVTVFAFIRKLGSKRSGEQEIYRCTRCNIVTKDYTIH